MRRQALVRIFVRLWLRAAVVASAALCGQFLPTRAASLFDGSNHLVMVDDAGCVYCAKWDRDARQGYEASPEGQFAPLIRQHVGSPELSGLGRLAYTPTFVLIVRGREAGRIVGYAGADFFWAEIDRLFAKAGFRRDAIPQPPIETRALLLGPAQVALQDR